MARVRPDVPPVGGMDRTSAALVVLAAHDRVGEPPREVPADTEGIGRAVALHRNPVGTALRNRGEIDAVDEVAGVGVRPDRRQRPRRHHLVGEGLEHLVGRQRAADLLSPAVAEPNREEGVVALGQRAVGGLVGLDRGAQGLVVVESQRRVPVRRLDVVAGAADQGRYGEVDVMVGGLRHLHHVPVHRVCGLAAHRPLRDVRRVHLVRVDRGAGEVDVDDRVRSGADLRERQGCVRRERIADDDGDKKQSSHDALSSGSRSRFRKPGSSG